MIEIKKLVAAVSPDVYCKPEKRKEVKKIIKEKGKDGYLEAAKNADLVDQDYTFTVDEAKLKPLDAPGLKSPVEQHKLVYDSPQEGLEAAYFWILDFVQGMFRKTEKIVDNFVSSPGSGHFSELGQKTTKMQEEAMKTLGAVNQVLKSILNIIYDLKEFRLRLEVYNQYRKGNPDEKSAALLSLKQIWLDNVDFAKRGNTSIKALAQQFDYVTLIDGFMAARSLNDVTKEIKDGGLDLNERVRRILQQRVSEFYKWIDESEIELKKRFEIEKKYLKSQYNTIQLYSRWVKPYLKAAQALEQRAEGGAAMVTAFNTIVLELVLLAQSPYSPDEDVQSGDLPEVMKNVNGRKYSSVILIELKFRGIPQRAGQGYSFGGRTEVTFTSFGLNDQEISIVKELIEKDNLSDTLSMIDGATTESIEEIKKDIEDFLDDKKETHHEKKKESSEDSNPFTALFSFFKSEKKKKERDEDFEEKGIIKSDTVYEKILRSQAIINARDNCKTVFEIYKKSHQMPAW